MTDDLISRQRTVDALETVGYDFSESELSEVELEEVCGAVSDVRQDMIDMIKQLPSEQPSASDCWGCNCPKMERLCGQSEHIKGRWIYTGVKFPNWEGQVISEAFCSECNGISYFRRVFDKYIGANICPNCGAEMEVTT